MNAREKQVSSMAKWRRKEDGAVSIVVAISLFVLLGFLALVLDGGYLYATKNKYQNAVEAAALAGSIHLCGEDPVLTAREIAKANGIPYTEEEGLDVALGFYDEHDRYEDFGVYKDFVEDPDPNTSRNEAVDAPNEDPVHNNAVMVSLNGHVQTALAGFLGYNVVQVSTAAVAYLERYLMVSLEEDERSGGITTISKGIVGQRSWDWIDGGENPNPDQPQFRNGDLYSNSDMEFFSGKTCDGPSFINSNAYAHGKVYPGRFGTDGVPLLVLPKIDWQDLKEAAESYGKVIDLAFFQNLPRTARDTREGLDRFGNCYRCNLEGENPYFCPRPGDHDGRIYYVTEDVGESIWIGYTQCDMLYSSEYGVTNLALAFRSGSIGFDHGDPLIMWGGEEPAEMVRFYSGADLMLGGVSENDYASDAGNILKGAVFLAEGDFGYRPSGGFGTASDTETRLLRVVAGKRIILAGYEGYIAHYDRYPVEFDANFGPPCPPSAARLGQLESVMEE